MSAFCGFVSAGDDMPAIQCRITSHSLAQHLHQVYTGFVMLHRMGLIRLTQQCRRDVLPACEEQHLADAGEAHLRVLVNGRIRLHYDFHDAHELNADNVDACDFYFKRSYLPEYVGNLPRGREKVFPLGLNYSVLPDHADPLALRRGLALSSGARQKLLATIDALDGGNVVRYNARLRDLEALPDLDAPPKVLFLVTAYDPHDNPGRSQQKVEEFTAINETRAQCIKLLRKHLGGHFLGGFAHNDFTRRRYPELLVDPEGISRKRNYLRLLHTHSICVATTGLHGSTGWKFAEYIALSKAIVSERLRYKVPGNLADGANYLSFGAPHECLEKCSYLMDDRDARARLMLNNARYYRAYLRPDTLILNTLLQSLAPEQQLTSAFPASASRTVEDLRTRYRPKRLPGLAALPGRRMVTPPHGSPPGMDHSNRLASQGPGCFLQDHRDPGLPLRD
jgi:hypothetical protein